MSWQLEWAAQRILGEASEKARRVNILSHLKDASDTLAKRGFFRRKKPRTLFDLQKRVLKIWRRPSSQKASIFPKESIGEHFTTVRATRGAETAPPPKVQQDFLQFASTWS